VSGFRRHALPSLGDASQVGDAAICTTEKEISYVYVWSRAVTWERGGVNSIKGN
jgi:hypothetical protein